MLYNAEVETVKHLHAGFPLTVEQHQRCHDVADVSQIVESLFSCYLK